MIANKTADCATTMHFFAASLQHFCRNSLPDSPCSFGPASVVRPVGAAVARAHVTEADSGFVPPQ